MASRPCCSSSLEHLLDLVERRVGKLHQVRAHIVVAQVREQHAERREHARRAGNDDVADADLARDRDRVQRPRAAIGHEREVAGVEAALGGDALHRVGHGGGGDAQDAVGGLRRAHAERLADLGAARARRP